MKIFGIPTCKKVVFLDIDGVLCTSRTMLIGHDHRFDPIGVAMLRRLFDDHPDWRIVMSSTWRMFGGAGAVLRSHGLMNTHQDEATGQDPKMFRSNEIQAWLDAHPEVEHYLIIDDEEGDIVGEHKKHLVKTSMMNGILMEHWIELDKRMKAIAAIEANLCKVCGKARRMGSFDHCGGPNCIPF